MTIHIPKWLLVGLGVCLVAFVAFIVGRQTGHSDSGQPQTSEPASADRTTPSTEPAPVLGNRAFSAPYGSGFGTEQPIEIYNGGDASGQIENITWQDWGATVSTGQGSGHQFRPEGGYYDQPVDVQLMAKNLGRCPQSPRPAYTMLLARFPDYPGGPLGPWHRWSGSGDICEYNP